MLDTLNLRVHAINDLKKGIIEEMSLINGYTSSHYAIPEHNDLYKAMLAYKGKNHHSVSYAIKEIKEVSDNTIDDFLLQQNTSQVSVHQQTRKVMKFVDEDKIKEVNLSINGTYRVPSSYNGITYKINEAAGYIDYQLSIPKYLYGHSLAEFIPQVNSDTYNGNYFNAHTWAFQQKNLHKRLNSFLDLFIDDLCDFFQLECLLNKRYIEIRRFDLCFNQHFDTKDDSLRYLEHLKQINYKRYKSNQKAPVSYNTSLEYHSSSGAYFKIYHKGTEYSMSHNGDFKKHYDENKKYLDKIFKKRLKKLQNTTHINNLKYLYKSSESALYEMSKGTFLPHNYEPKVLKTISKLYLQLPYKIDFFKKSMDKVLRYEVSLSSNWISYYYKHKFFRKNCDIHLTSYLKYKEVVSINDARNKNKTASMKMHRNHKMMNGYLNRKVHLMLEVNPLLSSFEKRGNIDYSSSKDFYRITHFGLSNTLLHDKDVGLFSDDIMKWAVTYFKRICDKYQVQQIDPNDDLESKIVEYNNKVDFLVNEYDEINHYKIFDDRGLNLVKGNRRITKASQLLTQKERSDFGMKRIRPLVMVSISRAMNEGKSLRKIRMDLKISNSQWSRYRKDLERFGITDKSRVDPEPINTCTDFSKIYSLLSDYSFYSKFYVNSIHSNYE